MKSRSIFKHKSAWFFCVIVLLLIAIFVYDGRFLTVINNQGISVASTTNNKISKGKSTSHIIQEVKAIVDDNSNIIYSINHTSVLLEANGGINNINDEQGNNGSSSSSNPSTIITIIVDLTGEMGNNLHHIAHARGIQIVALVEYNISTTLVLRQAGTQLKGKTTSRYLKQCFPNLRSIVDDSETFDTELFNTRQHQQQDGLDNIDGSTPTTTTQNSNSSRLSMPSGQTLEDVHDALQYLKDILLQFQSLQQQEHPKEQANATVTDLGSSDPPSSTIASSPFSLFAQTATKINRENYLQYSTTTTTTTTTSNTNTNTAISLPFLHVKSMCNRQFIDLFYDDYVEFFKFDDNACCNERPYPEESVFHFRNFLAEFPKGGGAKSGLEELSPNKTANELFGDAQYQYGVPATTTNSNNVLSPANNIDSIARNHGNTFGNSRKTSKKIAITTRFAKHRATQQYVKALTNNGFDVRVISNQTAVQDFCFLSSAQYELVGSVRSTFLVWAGILSPPTCRVRLYSVESPHTRRKSEKSGRPFFRTYNWTNPKLQSHILFELYSSEEMDEENSQS